MMVRIIPREWSEFRVMVSDNTQRMIRVQSDGQDNTQGMVRVQSDGQDNTQRMVRVQSDGQDNTQGMVRVQSDGQDMLQNIPVLNPPSLSSHLPPPPNYAHYCAYTC